MITEPRGAVLRRREDLSDTLARFRFELEDGVPDFRAGQYVTLGLPCPPDGAMVWRPYSVASPPSDKGGIDLLVRHSLEPAPGRFTTELWDLPIGGLLNHRGIKGLFTLDAAKPDGSPDDRVVICVASGTGLAPFLSMALEMNRASTNRELVILHGASYVQELASHLELAELAADTSRREQGFRLRYVPTISRPEDRLNDEWIGECGRVESLLDERDDGRTRIEFLIRRRLEPGKVFVMACGFDATINAVLAKLEGRGFTTARKRRPDGTYDLKFESYG